MGTEPDQNGPLDQDAGRQLRLLGGAAAARAAEEAAGAACIEGVIDRVVYENPENGFFVARLQEEGKSNLTTFVGNLMAVSPGETVRLWGRWVDDPRWGRQMRVERYETILPETARGIEKYLGSGLIEGIGPTFAKRLVKAFGRETLRVIDEAPERLREVEGIGRKRAAQIRAAWAGQKTIQSIMLFLQGHGIGTGQAVRIYKRYGDAAVAVLRENPFRLVRDVAGIGFRGADTIAAALGMAPDAPERAEAGLLHALDQAADQGHVFLPEPDLLDAATRLLEIEPDRLAQPLVNLVVKQEAVREDAAVYPRLLYHAETGCARLLRRLMTTPSARALSVDVPRALAWIGKHLGVTLSPEQAEAIAAAVRAKVLVITGGPGTGKTTLVRSVLAILERKGLRILQAAPTGRAAKRLEEATGRPARTLHRLLEFSPKDGAFVRNEDYPLGADLIVVDESSMIDCSLMFSLLKAVPPHARLFLVGDVDQLPSVGPGCVLMDVIACGAVPVVWLKTVFRQAAESGIVSNAHRINTGQYPAFNAQDFFLVERTEGAHARETVLELVTARIPRKFGFDPVREVQVLAPMRRGPAGVEQLNDQLQAALNPDGAAVPRKNLRVGDKVMQLRNNYELDVFNGDVGTIAVMDEEAKELEVAFEERRVIYGFDQLDDLALAYATTVHKAQGSEYPAVVLTLMPGDFPMLQRNLLYTAVTRGKQIVVIVGDPKAVRMALGNERSMRRHTRLAQRLRGLTAVGGAVPSEPKKP